MNKLFVTLFLVFIVGASALKHRNQQKFLLKDNGYDRKEIVAEVKNHLKAVDVNGDGNLSWDEVESAMKAEQCDAEEISQFKTYFHAHANKDGKISLDRAAEAIVSLIEHHISQSSMGFLQKKLQKKGSQEEIEKYLKEFAREFRAELGKMDKNGDGHFTWDEIKASLDYECKTHGDCLSKEEIEEEKKQFESYADKDTKKVNIDDVVKFTVELIRQMIQESQSASLVQKKNKSNDLAATIRAELKAADSNGDGNLSWDEIETAMKAEGVDKEDAESVKMLFDHYNVKGKLNIEKAVNIIVYLINHHSEPSLLQKKNDGEVTLEEFLKEFAKQFRAELKKIDKNGDSHLSWNEVEASLEAECKRDAKECLSKKQLAEEKADFNSIAVNGKVKIDDIVEFTVGIIRYCATYGCEE